MEKLITWAELNTALRKMNKEADVMALLKAERKNSKRARWLRRIYARYSRLRRKRERREVVRGT